MENGFSGGLRENLDGRMSIRRIFIRRIFIRRMFIRRMSIRRIFIRRMLIRRVRERSGGDYFQIKMWGPSGVVCGLG